MVNSTNSFVSSFNFGILNSKRRILVRNTFVNRIFLTLLLDRGYILNYAVLNKDYVEIYQNFTFSKFKLKVFKKSTIHFFSNHELKAMSNSGRVFIISTSQGYMFSDTALINGIGGTVILEIKFIN